MIVETSLQSEPLEVQIAELKRAAVEYNGCRIRPSVHAFEVLNQFRPVFADYPSPELTPDGDAGIDVEWANGDQRVCFLCPENPDQKITLCWRFTSRYEGGDMSATLLSEKLAELFGDSNE